MSGPQQADDHFSIISRFIFDKRHFSIQKLKPKPSAFLPPPDLKTSTFWIDGLQEDQVWEIGDNVARESQRASAPARADLRSSAVIKASLSLEPDPEIEDPRHVNICGWPVEKEQRLALAQELCHEAVLRIRQQPPWLTP